MWVPLTRDTLHDALWAAMRVNDEGSQIAWEIESDDGTALNRQQISEAIRLQRRELTANPPKKY